MADKGVNTMSQAERMEKADQIFSHLCGDLTAEQLSSHPDFDKDTLRRDCAVIADVEFMIRGLTLVIYRERLLLAHTMRSVGRPKHTSAQMCKAHHLREHYRLIDELLTRCDALRGVSQ